MGKKINELIINFFINELNVPTEYFDSPDCDEKVLFSNGLVDSFGVLRLIAFLEETFTIIIDTNEHEINEFDSLRKIKLILTLKGIKNDE